ncbi:MAG TPA: TraR/DksA C4-type zinc finger protein [Acidimicrobiales bacterium]|jgi:RNA polymerase-binding transcription factor DksA|nr:TraR/DksA C4-type zinc finger protein [Acidimicrobiales bacterium]
MDEVTARHHLESERAATVSRIRTMRGDYEAIIAGSVDANADDEHDPEGATVAFERAQVGSLLAEAEATLAELDRAMVRLKEGTYWRCDQCGGPIASERLEARPAASSCIRCASGAPSTRPGDQPGGSTTGAPPERVSRRR